MVSKTGRFAPPVPSDALLGNLANKKLQEARRWALAAQPGSKEEIPLAKTWVKLARQEEDPAQRMVLAFHALKGVDSLRAFDRVVADFWLLSAHELRKKDQPYALALISTHVNGRPSFYHALERSDQVIREDTSTCYPPLPTRPKQVTCEEDEPVRVVRQHSSCFFIIPEPTGGRPPDNREALRAKRLQDWDSMPV